MRGTTTRLWLGVWLVASLACTRSRDLNRELAEAAGRGDTAAVHALLEAGADVNASPALWHQVDPSEGFQEPPRTALMRAAAGHHSDTVRALLAAGANANWQNFLGETALSLAVTTKWAESSALPTFQALTEAKVDVNAPCSDGQTALSLAAQMGNVPAVIALLSAGASIHRPDNHGQTALWSAARHGQAETAEVLLRFGAGVDAKNWLGQTALGAAAESGNPATVKVLLAHGAQVPGALRYATTAAVAEALLEAGANAKLDGPAALVVAARMGRDDLTQTLLREGASARGPEGPEALKIAEQKGLATMVAILKQAGAALPLSPPPRPSPPQAELKHAGTALPLRPPPPPAPPEPEWMKSPLIKAAYEGNMQKVLSVIAKGTDVNATIGGWTALEAAASHGHTEVVRALIAAGADAKGRIGRKALKQAVVGGHVDTAKVLIAAGVNVKGQAAAEFTPLVPSGHPEMLRILQEGGEAW